MKRIQLLVFSIVALAATALWVYFEHFQVPRIREAETWNLKPYAPEVSDKNFRVVPFFYTAGSFHTQVAGEPLFVILPYRKGPPSRFISQVQFHWSSPTDGKGKIVIQGPKTPIADYSLESAKGCMNESFIKVLFDNDCITFRNQALRPLLKEIVNRVEKPQFNLRWFEVKNDLLKTEQRPQGLFISAVGPRDGLEAYILFLPKGTLQVFWVHFPRTSGGEKLRINLEESVRSLRTDSEIAAHRIWIDRELSQINLAEVMKQTDGLARMTSLAEVQFVLASKLSVDPSRIEPYFHLGGTSRILHLESQKNKRYDWGAQARDLLQDMIQYSRDVDRLSPKTAELERLLVQLRKD